MVNVVKPLPDTMNEIGLPCAVVPAQLPLIDALGAVGASLPHAVMTRVSSVPSANRARTRRSRASTSMCPSHRILVTGRHQLNPYAAMFLLPTDTFTAWCSRN